MIQISDINSPLLSYYRNLRFTPELHTCDGVFLCEGSIAVRKLLESNMKLHSILLDAKQTEKLSPLLGSIDPVKILVAEKAIIDEAVGFKLHEAALAAAFIPDESALENMPDNIIALNGIINSENVGALVRNALAFGFKGILYDGASSSPFLRRAVRVSMGAVCFIKHRRSLDLHRDIKALSSAGYRITACETAGEAINVEDMQYAQKRVFILGSEKHGVSPELLTAADEIVKIPINPLLPSINVAAASAIMMHKANSMSSANNQ